MKGLIPDPWALQTAERKEQPIGIGTWGSNGCTGDLFDGDESSNDRNHKVHSKYLCILRSLGRAGSDYQIEGIARVVEPGENRVGSTDPLKERGWKEGNLPPHIRTDTVIAPTSTCIRDSGNGAYSGKGHVFCLAVPQHCPNTPI